MLGNTGTYDMAKFLGSRYRIPNYQREYVWEETHLSAFWDDLEDTISDKSSNHFFGQIVIHHDEDQNFKYIIDGQQRTITSIFFLRALQIFYAQIMENSLISDASLTREANYKQADISSQCIGWRPEECHLKLSESDEGYFMDMLFKHSFPESKKAEKKPHERMRKAFCFFYDAIKTKLDEIHDVRKKIALLNEYYDAFTKRFQILYMEATKLEEAFTIFETLNARGCELGNADLLKNFLFSHSDNAELAQKLWTKMINSLGKADPNKFIRHFWNSNHPFAQNIGLYGKISKAISTHEESSDFFSGLVKCAPYYHDLVFPDKCTEFKNKELVSSLQGLEVLGASVFYPVILAMKQASVMFTDEDIREVSTTIETYMFRNLICKKNSNKTERVLARVAKDVYDGKVVAISEICARIKKEIVEDREFFDAFLVWCAPKTKKDIIRYILRKIHHYLDPNSEINTNNDEVHVEHIMPENNSLWHVPRKIHEEYLWRLGNLALLGEPLNKSASNKPFSKKKSKYRISKIEPNKQIAECAQWTSKEIEDRQRQLATYAIQIWSK